MGFRTSLPGAILAAAATVLTALGQTPVITGYVTDPSGRSIARAEMLLACGDRRVGLVKTADDGRFEFRAPAGAACEIRVNFPGFDSKTLPVTPGGDDILVQLGVAELRQEVTVSGSPAGVSIEPEENVDTVEIDGRTLEMLPVMDQDVIGAAAAFLDAGMSGTAGYSIVVDGLETDDAGVSGSAIREVRINRNPYSAEYYSPGRGRIEVSTRQGGKDFHGAVNVSYRDHHLYARNAFATEKAPERRMVVEGSFSGPVTPDGRTAFLAGGEYERDDDWSLIHARTPAGLRNQPFAQPSRETEFFGGVTRFVSDVTSFSVRFEYEQESEFGRGVGGYDLPDMAYDGRDSDQEVRFTHQSVIRGGVLNEFRARVRWEDERAISRVSGRPSIVVEDAFASGGAQQDEISRDQGVELQDLVSWNRGRHFVKSGIAVNDLTRRLADDRSGRDGAFYFSSLEDYAGGRPFAFEQQTGDGRVLFWTAQVAGFLQDDIRIRSNLSVGVGLRYQWHTYPAGWGTVAPRGSLAWAPGSEGRTILRAGAGLFYDRMSSATPRDTMLHDGRRLRRIVLTNPGFPDPFAGSPGIGEAPADVVRFHPRLASPRMLHYSAGLERRLADEMTLAVTCRGIEGWRLFRSLDRNAPTPPEYQRPDASIATLREIQSDARLSSRAVEVALRGEFARYVTGGAIYTLGLARNNTGGIGWMPPDSLDLSGEWSRASFDRRHRLRAYGTLRFPRFFDVGVMLSASSGRPYSLTTGRDTNRDGRANDRPPGVIRNSLNGPGEWTVDLRWSREFPLPASDAGGGASLRLAVDAFNLLNHVNPTRVVGNISSPFFGQPTGAEPPRRVQFSLRLKF